MIVSWCFICAFVVLINKVSLQDTVEGFIGGSVVLPCSSDEHDHKLQDIHVLWRNKDSEIFYNLISGKDSVAGQNPRYKNRAQTFPEEYERGNFSIKLQNLTRTDEGEFSCFITHTHELSTIQLILKESTEENGNKTTEENEGSRTQSDLINISICVFTVLALTVASITA
ncbi:CD276 antigen homolog isoform X4 [Carassius carassius]|uniref:CD276 antigen homolog isoform X4 n=1 Tax=Carassius carassius TaxID=217509 RepID=UPI002868812D|nr:CD276 antigen homolog isoform X4 [Carassius carassius]